MKPGDIVSITALQGVRRLNPGEFIQNSDGSRSTELSITVTNPKLNQGKPTNIPSIWSIDGKPTKIDSEDLAVDYAIQTGEKWNAFNTIEEAEAAAKARSEAGGRFADAPTQFKAGDVVGLAELEAPADFASQTPFQRNIVTPFKQGVEQGTMALGALGLSSSQAKLEALENIDDMLSLRSAKSEAATRRGVETATRLGYDDPAVYARDRWGQDPDVVEYGHPYTTPERRKELQERALAGARTTAAMASDALNRMALLPQDEEFNAAIQTEDLELITEAIIKDPLRIWRLALPGLTTTLAGAPLGPAGVAATSGTTEFGSSIIQTAAEAGLNPYRAEDLVKVINSPELWAKAKGNAQKAGAAVGLMDMVGAKFAARGGLVAPHIKGGLKREAVGIAENLPIQAGTGALGEATKQQLTEGGITSPANVFLEAIGELGGTPGEVIALGLATGRYRRGGAGIPDPDTDAPLSNKSLADVIALREKEKPVNTGEAPTPPEAPGTGGQVPGEQGDKERPSYRLEDLPQATEIMKSNGFEGSPEALKQARLAQRSFVRANRYASQGLPEYKMKEMKVANEALAEAVRLGFRMPEKKTPEGPKEVPGMPGWTLQDSDTLVKKDQESGLYLIVKQTKGGFFAYPADTPTEAPPAGGGQQKIFKTGQEAANFIDGLLTKVKKDQTLPPEKLKQEVTPPVKQEKLGPSKVADPEGKQFYVMPFSLVGKRRPIASFSTREEANTFISTTKPLLGENEKFEVVEDDKSKWGDIAQPPQEALLIGSKIRAHLNTSNLPRQPALFLEQDYPEAVVKFNKGENIVVLHDKVDARIAKKIEGWLRVFVPRFTPNAQIVIDIRLKPKHERENSNGSIAVYTGKRASITIRQHVLQLGDANILGTLSHELGHLIMAYEWASAKPTVQQAIFKEWLNVRRKYLEPDSSGTWAEFLGDIWSWPKYTNMLWGATNAGYTNKTIAQKWDGTIYESWFSFDEFMAEQISRYMLTNQRALSISGRFFKAVARQMKEFLTSKLFNPKQFEPAEAVSSWLTDLMNRKDRELTPLSSAGAVDGHGAGIEQNRTSEEQLGDVPLPQSENHYLHENQISLGLSKKSVVQQDRYTSWLRFWPNLLQLAEKNPHIQGLQRYTEYTRQWMIEKMEIIARADLRVKAWRKLSKEMGRRLSNFLFEMEEMTYLKPGDNARWPTTQELVAIARRLGLSKEALEVYFDIKADFLDILDRIEKAWIRDAQRSIQNPALLSQNITEIKTEMNALRAKPYFPHERFGDWTVTVYGKKGAIKHFEQVDSSKEADRLKKLLLSRFPGHQVAVGKLTEEVKIFQGLPPTLLKQMALKVRDLNAQQMDDIDKLVFAMSPANSFSKHFARRKGTAGYSTDGLRAYANYFLHAGGHIARLRWRYDLQESVNEVERSARVMGGTFSASAVGKRQGIADWMKRHLEYIMNPPSEWVAARSFAFFWHMGYNASSALVNLTQVPMVAYPYLAARYGDVGAVNQLRKATMDIRKLYTLKGSVPQDERDAITLGVAQGFLDESMNADLAGAAQHGVLGRIVPGTQFERTRMFLAHYSSIGFQLIEKMNRRVVFRAAYRLARKDPSNKYVQEVVTRNQLLFSELIGGKYLGASGQPVAWSPANAAAYIAARDAVEKSQFNYASYARPEFIRGRKGVIFAFWMFKQNMLYFFKNDPGAWRALLIMGMTAGLMGLPFAGDLAEVLKYGARALFGKDFDLEREARSLIIDLSGDAGLSDQSARRTADLITLGLGRESMGLTWMGEGVGIPVPAFDVSSRLGMGKMIPGLTPTMKYLSGERRLDEAVGAATREVVGASYGVPLTMLKAVETGSPDDFKKWENALPAAARNLLEAYRLATKGETNRQGAVLAEYDMTNSKEIAEVIGAGLGFNPTSSARAWDVVAEQKEVISFWMIQRKMLFESFDKARLTKDRETMADVKEAIRRFNREAPDGRLRIKLHDLLQSSKQRELNRRKMEQGKALQKSYSGVAEEAKDLYPSTTLSNP